MTNDTINRLAVDRPEHRPMRIKFDPNDEECLSEQNNKKMTFEDNIH